MQKISFRQKITLVLLGIIGCVILLETGLRIGGGIILLRREHKNRQALKEKDVCRIMCLGGSTTADGGEYSYPAQLEKVLNEKDRGVRFVVINKGVCGCNSTYILSKLKENLDKYKPDIVITMMGLNDGWGTVPYEESVKVKLNLFLRSFRVYKLAKLIWLHGVAKIQDIRNYKSKKKREEHNMIRVQSCSGTDILIEKFLIYANQEKREDAKKVMKEAIEKSPESPQLYALLGDACFFSGEVERGLAMVEKALVMQPNDVWIIAELGMLYRLRQKYAKAEEVLKKGLEVNPMSQEIYGELTSCYIEQKKLKGLQELCNRIISLNLESSDLYSFVATSYHELGMYDEAEKYYQKANEFRLRNYKEATRYNYRKLKEIVTQRGIQLVCVQYPVRNVEALKKLFESREEMIFVDNENLFKVALKYNKYENYFRDNIGGEFGHCTPRGNRLLAKNIANVILKEYFNK